MGLHALRVKSSYSGIFDYILKLADFKDLDKPFIQIWKTYYIDYNDE